jgi:hypothetical protein
MWIMALPAGVAVSIACLSRSEKRLGQLVFFHRRRRGRGRGAETN